PRIVLPLIRTMKSKLPAYSCSRDGLARLVAERYDRARAGQALADRALSDRSGTDRARPARIHTARIHADRSALAGAG
ncbi:hypothetical protein ACWC5I_37390, partial [Kitasatospora sp. NPDC001574]